MKRRLITLMTMGLLVTSSASAQLSFGAQAGMNLGRMNFESDNGPYYDENKSYLIGLNAGVALNYEMSDAFSFRTGLLFSQKGVKFEDTYSYTIGPIFGVTSTTTVTTNTRLILNYIELPLALRINLALGDATLFIEGGPYLGYAISGKSIGESESTTVTDDNGTESSSTSSSSDTDNDEIGNDDNEHIVTAFDFGVYPGAGMRFGNFEVGVSYRLGLANMATNQDNGNTINNSVIGVNFRFWFGD